MRKLVYELANGTIVETLEEAKANGNYTTKMVVVENEETPEEEAAREARVAKRLKAMGKECLLG